MFLQTTFDNTDLNFKKLYISRAWASPSGTFTISADGENLFSNSTSNYEILNINVNIENKKKIVFYMKFNTWQNGGYTAGWNTPVFSYE